MGNKHPLFDKDVRTSFPTRLQMLVKAWQKMVEPDLKHRKQMLTLRASGFFDLKDQKKHLMNLTGRGCSAVVAYLTEGNQKVLIETPIPNYRGWALTRQLAFNYWLEKNRVTETVKVPVAENSLFGCGITRVSFTYDRVISLKDEQIKYGGPCIDVIDDSNYVGDPSARRRKDFVIEGDVYRLPTEYAKDFFGKKFADEIKEDARSDGQLLQRYSPEEMTKPDFNRDSLALRSFSTFIDLYLYDENTIVTIMPEGKKAVILREIESKNGETPYDVLAYNYFPESPRPLPPAWDWYAMDNTMNAIAVAMQEQAEAQKDVVAYTDESADDMQKIVDAPNMGTIRVKNLESIKPISFGGVNPVHFSWFNLIENEFTKQGGNADVIGGRGSQSPTLGQEQLVYNNAIRLISIMRTRFNSFWASVLRKVSFEIEDDLMTKIPILKEIPGVVSLPVIYTGRKKVGDFEDFVLKISPYTASDLGPDQKWQRMMSVMTQWILPTLKLAQAQGAQLDVPTATKILADYMGLENFEQWYRRATGSEPPNLSYTMKPTGQQNDSFGATLPSRMANLNQQQQRAGGEPSPPHNSEEASARGV